MTQVVADTELDVLLLLRCARNTDNGVAEAEANLDAKACSDSDRASHRGYKTDMQQVKEEEEEAENTDNVDTALQG